MLMLTIIINVSIIADECEPVAVFGSIMIFSSCMMFLSVFRGSELWVLSSYTEANDFRPARRGRRVDASLSLSVGSEPPDFLLDFQGIVAGCLQDVYTIVYRISQWNSTAFPSSFT